MEQKTQELPDVFEQLRISAEQKEKLKEVDTKRVELEKENQEAISEYERNVEDLLQGKETAKIENLSKLEIGVERGKKFRGEVTNLAQSLTAELQELGQFIGDMKNYKGLGEKLFSKVGLENWANKMRLSRVIKADLKEEMHTIIDYGHHMVLRLNQYMVDSMECYQRLENIIIKTGGELEKNQPIYETWRAKREGLVRDMKTLQDKLDTAAPEEYAKLEPQKTELQKKLDGAQFNENHFFTIVKKAKEGLAPQRTNQQAYKDSYDSLMQLRTGLEKDIEHVTQIYLSAPTIIKIALGTKAASRYDKGMKYATDITTDTVLKSAAGILEEVASRMERPLIEPEKLDAYRKAQKEMRNEFDGRIDALKTAYATPEAAKQKTA